MVGAIAATFIGFMLGTIVAPGMAAIMDVGTQLGNMALPWKTPDVGLCIAMRRMEIISAPEFHWFMRRQGFDERTADNMYKSQFQIIEARMLVYLKWRGELTPEEFDFEEKRIGIQHEDFLKLERSMKYLPSPQDFVRFGVRETYRSDVVDKYGYDLDYPTDIDEDVHKIGIDPKWMRHYWRAHWELPGVGQGYDMLHRRVIDDKTLDELLRVKDIPQYWREKLIAVSYHPYTRVDVRRMYKLGILEPSEVYESYRDLGYDDEKATHMTDFTLAYGVEEPKSIAEGKVEEAYLKNRIDGKEAMEMLRSLGYNIEASNFIFQLWAMDKETQIQDAEVDVIMTKFVYGDIDELGVVERLDKLGISAEEREKIMTDIRNAKRKAMQMPTKADVVKWYNSKLITKEELEEHLRKLGYGEQYVHNYVAEAERPGTDEYRVPTKADVLNFYKKGLISEDEWVRYMFALGYCDFDILLYAQLYNIHLGG